MLESGDSAVRSGASVPWLDDALEELVSSVKVITVSSGVVGVGGPMTVVVTRVGVVLESTLRGALLES